MSNIAFSPVKKTLALSALVAVVAGLVIGVSLYSQNGPKDNESVAKEVVQTVADSAATSQQESQPTGVLGEQTTKNSGYQVSVTKLTNDGTYTSYKVTVTNTSKSTLQFSPGLQFQLVGLNSNIVKTMTVPKGVATFAGGPIEPNQTTSGVIYFASLTDQQQQLRFIPDVSTTDYVVVQ